MTLISASTLYDHYKCPHRVWRDKYGPQDEKSQETNPFVELLWEKGAQHEDKVIQKIGSFVDISQGTLNERFQKTLKAMTAGMDLIYQGVVMDEEMLGIPDLLRKSDDGTYLPIDIKSGMGYEGADEDEGEEGKPKKHYALQLCLYADLLIRLGFAREKQGSIIDIHGNEVIYPLSASMGIRTPQTYWNFYEETKKEVTRLLANQATNKPAMSKSLCGMCPWYMSCKKWCDDHDDLTNLFYLGRSSRDRINEELGIETIADFAEIDVSQILERKKKEKGFLSGLGDKSLPKYKRRAEILAKTRKPVLYKPLTLPNVAYEIFFDIEGDPTQDFVYMHGIYERSPGGERYIDFTATEISPEAEKEIWSRFWSYIETLPERQFAIYYYAPYEKTIYRKLQKRYPQVISVEKLEAFFENPNVIDLYNQVIQRHTDWPLGSYSLKEIAVYLGFKWRDETPSGALSIQWFNEYLKTNDPKILQRIREYNEDDCKATMVVKDGVMALMRAA